MTVTAAEVKELRIKTGAAMMECKAALVAADGDMSRAEEALKQRGIVIAKKREARATNQGRVFGVFSDSLAVLVELRCETDFVSENAEFVELGERCARELYDKRLAEPSDTINNLVVGAVARLRENILINSVHLLTADRRQCIVGYIHDIGRYASLVRLSLSSESIRDEPGVRALAADLALQITAFAPRFVSPEEISEDYRLEYEREYREEAVAGGKSGVILDTIISGRWRKHLEQVCLSRQPFIRDEDITVEQAVGRVAAEVGGGITVDRFAYVGIAPAVCL